MRKLIILIIAALMCEGCIKEKGYLSKEFIEGENVFLKASDETVEQIRAYLLNNPKLSKWVKDGLNLYCYPNMGCDISADNLGIYIKYNMQGKLESTIIYKHEAQLEYQQEGITRKVVLHLYSNSPNLFILIDGADYRYYKIDKEKKRIYKGISNPETWDIEYTEESDLSEELTEEIIKHFDEFEESQLDKNEEEQFFKELQEIYLKTGTYKQGSFLQSNINDLEFEEIYPVLSLYGNGKYLDYERVVDYFGIKVDGKYGLLNNRGIVAIEPKYDERFDFWEFEIYIRDAEGCPQENSDDMVFQYGMGHGYVDITFCYNEESQFLICQKGEDGPASLYLMDEFNMEILKRLNVFVYDEDGKQGIADKNGNRITDAVYDQILFSTTDLLAFEQSGKWGYMDLKGNVVIECNYFPWIENYSVILPCPCIDDQYVIVKNENNKYGIISKQGKTIIECKYDAISPFYEGKIIIKEKGQWKVIELSNLFS